MVTEEQILEAYQLAAKEQIRLMKLEEKHKELAKEIVSCRQSLALKKSKLREIHQGMTELLVPILEPA